MRYAIIILASLCCASGVHAQGTRLLRQPTLSATQIAFAYAGDIWVVNRDGGDARRLTSFPGAESNPHFSPDGKQIAFTMQLGANSDVYVIDAAGGEPRRLTWHPAADFARGWTPDGQRVLFSNSAMHAPVVGIEQLWTIAATGGVPERIPLPDGFRGSYSPDGTRLTYEKTSRWDVEWRNYRGGQTHPISIYTIATKAVDTLPSPGSLDLAPVWMADAIYFLSDRDWAANVWKYDVGTKQLTQLTHYKDYDVKNLDAAAGAVVYEEAGYLHLLDPAAGKDRQLEITCRGDLPWAEPTHYGMGKHGWVTGNVKPKDAPMDLIRAWVDESFRAIAPKKIVALLPHPDDIAIPGVRVIIGPPKRKPRKKAATANRLMLSAKISSIAVRACTNSIWLKNAISAAAIAGPCAANNTRPQR